MSHHIQEVGMNIQFFGDFSEHVLTEMKRVAQSRGHQVATPADVVFLMAYPRNIPLVAEAVKLGSKPKCVLVLRAMMPRPSEERGFWKTYLVTDIVNAPYDEVQTIYLFTALEAAIPLLSDETPRLDEPPKLQCLFRGLVFF